MFATLAKRTARLAVSRSTAVRQLSTKETAKFPAGLAEGGHPNVWQKEQLRAKFFNFREKPEIIPLVFVVGLACSMGIYKLIGSDARAPETTFNPSERRSMEKRLLERNVDKNDVWLKNFWHTGPFSRGREILGIKPSDPQLDYDK